MTACGYQSFEQMATQTYECGNSFCSQLGYVQWAIQLAPKAAQSQLDALNARLGLNLTLDDAAYLNGGNLNFTVPVGFIVPSNCSGSGDGRCTGDLDGIHFVDGYQYVHLDTANPWTSPGGFFAHTGVDVLLGNVGYLIIPRGCVTASNQPC